MAKTYAGRGGSQGDWRLPKKKTAAPPGSKAGKPKQMAKKMAPKPKKLAATYTGPSPFGSPEHAIQGVIDMVTMKPPKEVTENEVYRNLVRMYGEVDADEKMRAYRARGSNQLKRTGWGSPRGGIEYKQ